MKKQIKAETIANTIVSAFTARREAFKSMVDAGIKPVVSSEYSTIAKRIDGQSFIATIDKVRTMFDLQYFTRAIGNVEKKSGNDSDYMQLKSIEKVLKFFEAIALNDYKKLDGYTYYLLYNTLKNAGSLNAQACFITLSKRSMSEDEISVVIKKFMNATPGTASTQTSSTKELLRCLGLTNHAKGQREVGIELTIDAQALIAEHFNSLAA